MPNGGGQTFTGFIGVGGALPPTSVLSVWDADASSGSVAEIHLGAPSGVMVGDTMVACVAGGPYAGGGVPTLTADPAWTPVFDGSPDIVTNMYSKIADQADEDGTASYYWALTTEFIAGLVVAHIAWPRVHGRSLPAASMTNASTPSLSSPGGFWQLAYIYMRTASAFVQPDPDSVITSPATLLLNLPLNARSGAMRIYASNNVSPVVGEYVNRHLINFPRQGLVVAAVSS